MGGFWGGFSNIRVVRGAQGLPRTPSYVVGNPLLSWGGLPPPPDPPRREKNGTAVGPERPSARPTAIRQPSDDRPTAVRRLSDDRPTTVLGILFSHNFGFAVTFRQEMHF